MTNVRRGRGYQSSGVMPLTQINKSADLSFR
jgi:hypothetical protein